MDLRDKNIRPVGTTGALMGIDIKKLSKASIFIQHMSYTVIQGSEIDIQNNNKTRNSHSYVRLHYWSSIWNNYFFFFYWGKKI